MSVARKAFGVVGSLLFGGGSKKSQQQQSAASSAAAPSRNAAAEIAARMDSISKRRGGNDTRITGSAGQEATGVGAKTLLGL